MNTTEFRYLCVHPKTVFVSVLLRVCTNSEADSFEIVQAVQCLLGLGQVLGKLGTQQSHGEWHHGAWMEGGDKENGRRQRRRRMQGEGENKKQGWMRT